MKRNLLIIALVIVAAVIVAFVAQYDGASLSDVLESQSKLQVATTENVEYFPGAKGYLAAPTKKGVYPGVVMIHENRGLRPEIKQTAQDLAREGYIVLAVDLLGGVVEDQTGARALTANFKQDVGVSNMRSAVQYLKLQGATKIASLGWCFGGRQSIELAISGEMLDATVVYYGGGMATSTARLSPITWPVLGVFGDADQVIPATMVQDFQNSLNAIGVPNEVYIYPGVGHAFANPSNPNHAPVETADAWAKTLAFLERYVK